MPISVGSFEASFLVFMWGDTPVVVGCDELDIAEFRKRFGHNAKRAVGLNMDGFEAEFWLCYVEDCFDPPLAVVRADTFLDAEDTFVEELDWARLDDLAIADTPEDERHYSGGYCYDFEATKVCPVKLVRVEV